MQISPCTVFQMTNIRCMRKRWLRRLRWFARQQTRLEWATASHILFGLARPRLPYARRARRSRNRTSKSSLQAGSHLRGADIGSAVNSAQDSVGRCCGGGSSIVDGVHVNVYDMRDRDDMACQCVTCVFSVLWINGNRRTCVLA